MRGRPAIVLATCCLSLLLVATVYLCFASWPKLPDNLRLIVLLLEQYRAGDPAGGPLERPNYVFSDRTLFDSTRAPLRALRRLLLPILKLFFNPNPLIQALHIQSQVNEMAARRDTAARQWRRRRA